jgi:hypothetical protein
MNAELTDNPLAPRVYAPDFVHLLRSTQQMQYTLSQMADQKANLLMGTNFVIFTITVGQIKNPGGPPLALLILGAAAFVSAFFAVLAAMPAIKAPPSANGPSNILFFGSFSQLSEEEFLELIRQSAQTDHGVFEAFGRDIYQNGRVLARKKYKLLGFAYRALLAGLIASTIAFVLHLGWSIG